MSTFEVGKVNAGLDDRIIDITVEGGNGWGGNGYAPYRVLLNIDLKKKMDDDYAILCLTTKDAKDLSRLLWTTAEGMEFRERQQKTVDETIDMIENYRKALESMDKDIEKKVSE